MERLKHFKNKVKYNNDWPYHLKEMKVKQIRKNLENKNYMDNVVDKISEEIREDFEFALRKEKVLKKLKKDLLG